MNCPHHCEIYKAKQYSYKDLPIRLQNLEQFIGMNNLVSHGLTRVRGFTQDDAHIFASQIKSNKNL